MIFILQYIIILIIDLLIIKYNKTVRRTFLDDSDMRCIATIFSLIPFGNWSLILVLTGVIINEKIIK